MFDRLDITLLVDGVPIHQLIDPTDTRTDGFDLHQASDHDDVPPGINPADQLPSGAAIVGRW